jgi:hypothetical protein
MFFGIHKEKGSKLQYHPAMKHVSFLFLSRESGGHLLREKVQ